MELDTLRDLWPRRAEATFRTPVGDHKIVGDHSGRDIEGADLPGRGYSGVKGGWPLAQPIARTTGFDLTRWEGRRPDTYQATTSTFNGPKIAKELFRLPLQP